MGKLFSLALAGLLLVRVGYADQIDSIDQPTVLSSIVDEACEGQLNGKALQDARQKWQGKTVIFDSNVLLNDPFAVHKYPGAKVVIPGVVLEEIDGKKTDDKLGKAARTVARMIDELIRRGGDLRKGIALPAGGTLVIDSADYSAVLGDTSYDLKKADNKILGLAVTYTTPGQDNVVLVSDDINVRVKAAGEGVLAIPFEYDWVTSATKIEQTYKKLTVSDEELKHFLVTGLLPKPADLKVAPNEFVMLVTDKYAGTLESLTRFVYDRKTESEVGLRKLRSFGDLPFPPQNLEQAMALDLMMDPDVELVIAESPAGTGKTFLSMMAGMAQVKGQNKLYNSLMITRTLVQIGKMDLGAFPGSKDQKLAEWYESYYDNLRSLAAGLRSKQSSSMDPRESTAPAPGPNSSGVVNRPRGNYPKTNKRVVNGKPRPAQVDATQTSFPGVVLVAFPHLRGRSIPDAYIVMDEAQNSSIHEIKTFLTRAGQGSKVVVLGDVSQIDLPFLNERNNGLSVSASLFTAETLSLTDRSRVGFVKLTGVVRSDLAELSSRVFEQPLPNY